MEVYSQAFNNVVFEAPADGTAVSATASLDGGTPVTLTVVPDTASPRVRRAQLPFVPHDGTVRVNWTFTAQTFGGTEPVVISDVYDVVTPILSRLEIFDIHPNATADEVVRIEKAVRHIIQAHTGQRFGYRTADLSVGGDDGTALMLPERLISLSTVNGVDVDRHFDIDADGYLLRFYPWGVPPVKADYFGLHQHVGGVIHNPNGVKLGVFKRNVKYTLSGTWGWEEVPAAVREAAKLLVNDYACASQSYRDRYLTSMTAADWRIQYHSGAFLKTGNVRADQLLSDYVLKRGWAVI
jgi:hypothetical protein